MNLDQRLSEAAGIAERVNDLCAGCSLEDIFAQWRDFQQAKHDLKELGRPVPPTIESELAIRVELIAQAANEITAAYNNLSEIRNYLYNECITRFMSEVPTDVVCGMEVLPEQGPADLVSAEQHTKVADVFQSARAFWRYTVVDTLYSIPEHSAEYSELRDILNQKAATANLDIPTFEKTSPNKIRKYLMDIDMLDSSTHENVWKLSGKFNKEQALAIVKNHERRHGREISYATQ